MSRYLVYELFIFFMQNEAKILGIGEKIAEE